jgi:hypothetical protein
MQRTPVDPHASSTYACEGHVAASRVAGGRRQARAALERLNESRGGGGGGKSEAAAGVGHPHRHRRGWWWWDVVVLVDQVIRQGQAGWRGFNGLPPHRHRPVLYCTVLYPARAPGPRSRWRLGNRRIVEGAGKARSTATGPTNLPTRFGYARSFLAASQLPLIPSRSWTTALAGQWSPAHRRRGARVVYRRTGRKGPRVSPPTTSRFNGFASSSASRGSAHSELVLAGSTFFNAQRMTCTNGRRGISPINNHSVRQPAPAPAQQYFPLTPLQPPAPAPASQQYFSLKPLQSPAPVQPSEQSEFRPLLPAAHKSPVFFSLIVSLSAS